MAKKFILIDQSIASIAGHHYEYAVHVLDAAKRAGFEPCLATNVRFSKAGLKTPWRTFAFYHFSFWASQEAAQIGIVNWILGQMGWLRFRWRLLYHYSLFGLLWGVRDRFSEFLLKQPLERTHAATLLTLIPAAILLKLARFVVLLLLFPFALILFLGRSLVRLLKAGGFPENYSRNLFADAFDLRYFFSEIFSRRVRYMHWWQQYSALRRFRQDTERVLRESNAQAGDIVFVPTLSAIELMGLGAMLQGKPTGPVWRLLFRRDIYQGRESDYGSQEWRVQGLRNSLQVSSQKMKGHDVRFYTDTEELTRQYNRLGPVRFQTAPIPHTHAPGERSSRSKTLRIIYVGDARREKGYHLIPRVATDVWEDYVAPGHISFHLQSNFNIPQGEPEVVVAREELRHLKKKKAGAVELLESPMTSEQYKTFLLSGDINLLLYDPVNYYARSSGILVESLSAGVPVIVPSGCWLDAQFRDALYRYWKKLASDGSLVKSFGLGDLRWQSAGTMRASSTLERGNRQVFTWVRPPAGATRVVIMIRPIGTSECILSIEQADARGTPSDKETQLLQCDSSGEAVTVLRLKPDTSRISLGIEGLSLLADLRLDFLSSPGPWGAVGAVYRHPSEISGLIRDMIEHHEHYLATARDFATNWTGYHNADRLVAQLAARETAT